MLSKTDRRTTDSVLLTRRMDANVFDLIERADGGYDIAVNGEVLACFRWTSAQLDNCLRTFDTLTTTTPSPLDILFE